MGLTSLNLWKIFPNGTLKRPVCLVILKLIKLTVRLVVIPSTVLFSIMWYSVFTYDFRNLFLFHFMCIVFSYVCAPCLCLVSDAARRGCLMAGTARVSDGCELPCGGCD